MKPLDCGGGLNPLGVPEGGEVGAWRAGDGWGSTLVLGTVWREGISKGRGSICTGGLHTYVQCGELEEVQSQVIRVGKVWGSPFMRDD